MRIDLYSDGNWNVAREWKPITESAGREAYDAEREPFIWKTDKGKLYRVEDMATPHLVNAINMIWRNVFGIREDRPEIMNKWASNYVNRAAKELCAELQKRVENA